MRRRQLLASGVTAAIGLSAGELLRAAPAAAAAAPLRSVGVQLPVDDLRAIELDEARGRLYLAQGVGGGLPLVVTDLDGRLLSRITAVADISDLVLSDDGRILYVAQGFNRIIALDAATLTIIASYPAPPGAHLYTVEPSGEKVIGGFIDAGIGSGGLLIWSAPGTPPVVYTGGPNYHPIIDASPGAPGLLVAGDTGYSPATTYVIDVSGDSPTIVARRDNTGSNLIDYAVSPDGTEVVETVGYPYEHHSYRLPDLADATVYPSGVYPQDAAWSGDSSTVAIGRASTGTGDADVYLYAKGSTVPTYAVDFRNGDSLWEGTLLVNRDGTRAWAVSSTDPYQETQLLHSFGPAHPPKPPITDLAVTAQVGTGKDKQTAQLTVTWSSPIGDDNYWWITASTNGGAEREFWRSKLDASGKYTLTYSLPRGTTTFTVRYRDYWQFYPDGYATATLQR
ncbi:YncE family protein [Micromonospora sp. GCM10011542]|uniref:YncE family protein n=1 Tax=Micromonospora sp. GCM10011542 TaxID=3317337 RepID=UPI003609ADA9